MSDLVTQTLWIDGPMPGMNEMLDARKRSARFNASDGYSRLKTEWSAKIGAAIKAQGIKALGPTSFAFIFCERDKRRDPDNLEAGAKKLILDALVDHGVIANDNWDNVLGHAGERFWQVVFRLQDKPGVEVMMKGYKASVLEINRRRAKLDKRALDRAMRKGRRKV